MNKYYSGGGQSIEGPSFKKSPHSQPLKGKRWQELQKKVYRKQIFGEHFNYSRVGLNKEKKYMLEQERNTEIERANRILFEKIKRIGQRSMNVIPKEKIVPEQQYTEDLQSNYNRTRNQYFKSGRKYSPMRTTNGGLNQSKLSEATTPKKIPLPQKKILFKGNRVIDGR